MPLTACAAVGEAAMARAIRARGMVTNEEGGTAGRRSIGRKRARARIAVVNQGKSHETIAPEALAEFFAEVARSKSAADLALAGWFEYNRADFDKAEHWFSLAKLGSPAKAEQTIVNVAEGRAHQPRPHLAVELLVRRHDGSDPGGQNV